MNSWSPPAARLEQLGAAVWGVRGANVRCLCWALACAFTYGVYVCVVCVCVCLCVCIFVHGFSAQVCV